MYIIKSKTGKKYTLPFESSTCKNIVETLNELNGIEEIEIDLVQFTDSAIEEVINIKTLSFLIESLKKYKKILNISEEAFKLIDFLDLNYLLYNCNIPLNCNIPRIIELYNIKEESNYEDKLYKLINYFRDNLDYVNINYNNINIDQICAKGYVSVLKEKIKNNKSFKNSKSFKELELKYEININGFLFSDSWSKKYSDFNYTTHAIDYACAYGHIPILQCFKDNNLEFKYTSIAIDYASEDGRVNVLNFFKDNNLEFKYTKYAIDRACVKGHINILNFFLKNNLELKYTENAINYAFEYGNISVFDFFKDNKLLFKYTQKTIELANANYETKNLFKDNNIKIYLNENSFFCVFAPQWIKENYIKHNDRSIVYYHQF